MCFSSQKTRRRFEGGRGADIGVGDQNNLNLSEVEISVLDVCPLSMRRERPWVFVSEKYITIFD